MMKPGVKELLNKSIKKSRPIIWRSLSGSSLTQISWILWYVRSGSVAKTSRMAKEYGI